jgi:hypothetical protein
VRRLAVITALALVALALTPVPTGAGERASLEIVSVEPLRVRGEGFRALERARVTVRVDGRATVLRARAGPRGAFVVRVPTDGCVASIRAVAVGDRGTRATTALDHVRCVPTR